MARQLVSEKSFVVVISGNLDERYKEKAYYGILTSYISIMKATEFELERGAPFPISEIGSDVGTIIHIAPKEEIEDVLPTIPDDLRYIGYVNCDEGIITNNCQAYVGIPISKNYMQECYLTEGMWKVKYPHITLVEPVNADQLTKYNCLIGKTIHFKLAFNYSVTPNTRTNMAMIRGEKYHVTRWVSHGKQPSCAGKEMEKIDNVEEYMDLVGYPVFM